MVALSPQLEERYRRLYALWIASLLTPVLYLGLGWFIADWGWVPLGGEAAPFDGPALRTAAVVLGLVLAGALAWAHWDRRRIVRQRRGDLIGALKAWTRRFYAGAMLADSLACLGLLYFWASGHTWAMLAGGAGAYLAYALSCPQRRELADLSQLPPSIP